MKSSPVINELGCRPQLFFVSLVFLGSGGPVAN